MKFTKKVMLTGKELREKKDGSPYFFSLNSFPVSITFFVNFIIKPPLIYIIKW